MSPTSVINTDMGQEQYLLIPVSIGELVDKITILEIKKQNIKRQKAQENISNELQLLQDSLNSWTKKFPDNLNLKSACIKKILSRINQELWDTEESLRKHEAEDHFGQEFIKLARSVYILNDKRAQLKRSINTIYGSNLFEEKSHNHPASRSNH